MAMLPLNTPERVAASLIKLAELVAQHGWLLALVIVIPLIVVCVTLVILVLAVQPDKRAEAIYVLSPVLVALVRRSHKLLPPSGSDRMAPGAAPPDRFAQAVALLRDEGLINLSCGRLAVVRGEDDPTAVRRASTLSRPDASGQVEQVRGCSPSSEIE